jgi:hypothetical protein
MVVKLGTRQKKKGSEPLESRYKEMWIFFCRIYHKAAANTGSGLLPSIQNSTQRPHRLIFRSCNHKQPQHFYTLKPQLLLYIPTRLPLSSITLRPQNVFCRALRMSSDQ